MGLGAALIIIFACTVIAIRLGAEALGFGVLDHTHESPIVCGTGLTCEYIGDGRVEVGIMRTPC